MNKQQLLEQFMILIATMQNIAVDIIDESEYNDLGEFMDEIFSKLGDEEIDESLGEIKQNRIFGTVDKERTMQEIGDNQALMIFGESLQYEEE